ncbi:ThiF family adenylyltransferase [Mycoplasmatota bacterium]|nr:ThiF family adenylyltransferase [Mycoplasmatota bacterium]
MGNRNGIMIIGAGGTGSALFQDLCRCDIKADIYLVDGDRVQTKNIGRQHFSKKHVKKFKAESLVDTATQALGLSNLYYCNQYIKENNVEEILSMLLPHQKKVIVGCVDNHPTRKLIEEYFDNGNKNSDYYYVDCANGQNAGEVVATFIDYRKVHGSYRSEYDPNVLEDTTGADELVVEDEESCSDAIAAGNEQTIIANRKAAITALELITAYLRGKTKIGIIYFGEVISRVIKV